MVDREKFQSLVAAGKTARDISDEVGLSRQRVHILAKQMGLTLANGTRQGWLSQMEYWRNNHHRRGERAPPVPRVVTGGVLVKLTTHAVGRVAELLVAADLVARGWDVFLPLSITTTNDLVAVKDGKIKTFEVRCAKRVGGKIVFGRKISLESDHYALVVTGDPVIYRPAFDGEIEEK